MAQEEKYGTRDLTYSAWHRIKSLQRFIGVEPAQTASMIDLDTQTWVEYEEATKRPLMLVETALDVGQGYKNGTITKNEAKRGAGCEEDIPAYVVLYTPSDQPNFANPKWPDIAKFRVKRLWPDPETQWTELTPKAWAQLIVQIRHWSAKRLDKVIERESAA